MENDYVTLDVEGRIVKTKISTLTSVKNSYFSDLFQDQWTRRLDQYGHLFIDRNSETFMVVLGYLRDGLSYPLPEDEYTLRLIEHDARLFRLPNLALAAERQRSRLKTNSFTQNKSFYTTPTTKESSPQTVPVLSLPLPPPLLPSESKTSLHKVGRAHDLGTKKLPKKEKKNVIGEPSNFEHVVHIGWNSEGKRVIMDRSQDDEQSIKAIIAATNAQTAAQTPVYSMVTANNDLDTSESVDIFFAGPTFRPIKDNGKPKSYNECGYDNGLFERSNNDKQYNYSKPIKKRIAVTDM